MPCLTTAEIKQTILLALRFAQSCFDKLIESIRNVGCSGRGLSVSEWSYFMFSLTVKVRGNYLARKLTKSTTRKFLHLYSKWNQI